MCRGSSRAWAIGSIGVVIAALLASPAGGIQPTPTPPTPPSAAPAGAEGDFASETVEKYLRDRGLLEPLAAHLRRRVKEGSLPERIRAANLLGDLYVKQLRTVTDPAARQAIESQARELLKIVPEAESYNLRLDLAVATYLKAEEICERDRLRSIRPDEKSEAERVLRGAIPVFEDIGSRTQRQAERLEKQISSSKDEDVADLRTEIQAVYATRSKARYYAGWAVYYLAYLTNAPQRSREALEQFGSLLNAAPRSPATIERLPRAFLDQDHVARAVIGCALSHSLAGRDSEAIRWLDELENNENTAPSVKEQLFTRRLIVLAAARRWPEVERLVAARRIVPDTNEEQPLAPLDARLLAVLTLEDAQGGRTKDSAGRANELLAKLAFADLLARGEGGQVLDLVARYGTALIGDEGFLAHYVRGRKSFERARELHGVGEAAEQPTTDAPTVNQYREAAELLGAALASKDADRFAKDLPRVRMQLGLCRFFSGEFASAAEHFQATHAAAAGSDLRRDALWYAIVSLDRAVEQGLKDQIEVRDRVALVYLREFPETEDAIRLLLRQTQGDQLGDTKQLEMLLAVKRESPLFDAARRQAARLLYRAFRNSRGADQTFAANRFIEIAEEVLQSASIRALSSSDRAGAEAAQSAILYARQLLEAHLALAGPNLARLEAILSSVQQIGDSHQLDLSSLNAELAFRRVQIALARNDDAAAERAAATLKQKGGEFGGAVDRLLYNRSVKLMAERPADSGVARRVVKHGMAALSGFRDPASAEAAGVRSVVADAAATVWTVEGDELLRDQAIALDREAMKAGVPSIALLRRFAMLIESTGAVNEALAAWRDLMAGQPQSSDGWYEARYNSLRLLAQLDPKAARAAISQHEVLHPEYGPAPWGPKIREIAVAVRSVAPAPGGAPTVKTPPATPPAGGGG